MTYMLVLIGTTASALYALGLSCRSAQLSLEFSRTRERRTIKLDGDRILLIGCAISATAVVGTLAFIVE